MATSPHLSSKLREALGNEAGEELIATVDRAASDLSELRGDLAELRHQMELGFARIDTRFAGVDTKIAGIDTKFAGIDTKFAGIDTQLANLRTHIEKQTSRLILWSFGFWVTTLASLAALIIELR